MYKRQVFASPKAKTIANCLTTEVMELAATIEFPNLPKIAIPAAVPPALSLIHI